MQIQIQQEITDGVEVFIGIKRDPTFGPTLLFGAGGSLAELISDRNLRLLPLDLQGIEDLVKESKIYSVLKGNGGGPQYTLDKLYNLIFDVCKVFEAAPEIQELEINPVTITMQTVWAVDTKIILEPSKLKPVGPTFSLATTLKTDHLAGKTRYFEFESDHPIVFQPGQYLSVKVSDTRINCYSIAGQSSPTKFNLLVDSTPGGPGSKFFETLKVNDKVTYLGPFGTFTLKPENETETILFLATGCGLAPLKAMIEHLLNVKKVKQNIVLYLGFTSYEDIFMKDYLDTLSRDFSNFRYEIVIYNKSDNWKGLTGFITTPLKNDFPDTSKCSAYMCGNNFMIRDATKILLDNGCPQDRIYFEKYER